MTLKEIEMLIDCKRYVEDKYNDLQRQLANMKALGKDTFYIEQEIKRIEKIIKK